MVAKADGVPWFPDSLRNEVSGPQELLTSFSYVVLEEIVDEAVLLLGWPWPLADQEGRLYWDTNERPGQSVVDRTELRAQVYQPARLRREPRCGDTFAVEDPDRRWSQPVRTGVSALLATRVFDVTADAREAAKLAHLGSVAPVLPANPRLADALQQAETERLARRAVQLSADRGTGDDSTGEPR